MIMMPNETCIVPFSRGKHYKWTVLGIGSGEGCNAVREAVSYQMAELLELEADGGLGVDPG